jgi:hypothetical protein
MKPHFLIGLLSFVGLGLTIPLASAQTIAPLETLAGRPDKEPSPVALGPAFSNLAAGISLQPPAGGKMIRRPGDPEIVRYVYEKDNAVLTVTSATLKGPVPLTSDMSPTGSPGMLERAITEIKRANPAAQIMRQDTTTLGDNATGMVAARYTVGTNSYLNQQAIVQASDRLYYTITYLTPGAKPNTPDDAPIDPHEQAAVATFSAVLDSVKILDRSKIKLDQDQRLYRTRAFFVNLSRAKLEKCLIPQQWMRILKNGKDVGYLYIIEEKTTLGGFPAVKIGLRGRQYDDADRQIDTEAWLQMTTDRKHEKWSRLTVTFDKKKMAAGSKDLEKEKKKATDYATEIGASDLSTKAVATSVDGKTPIGAGQDIHMVDEYPLTVKYTGKTGAPEPVERMLPPWYLPQALGQLLPRALPLDERKGYLFASYVPDRREVMLRYIDVLSLRKIHLGDKDYRATPIEDKIGLDGFVTTHYIGEEGDYLGSETKYSDSDGNDVTITFIRSNAKELNQLWDQANLSRPAETPDESPGDTPVQGQGDRGR